MLNNNKRTKFPVEYNKVSTETHALNFWEFFTCVHLILILIGYNRPVILLSGMHRMLRTSDSVIKTGYLSYKYNKRYILDAYLFVHIEKLLCCALLLDVMDFGLR